MINRYSKGRNFEYAVIKWLEEQRFFVVRQAKSAFPDIIAIPPHYYQLKDDTRVLVSMSLSTQKPLIIECKTTGRLSSYEIKQLQRMEHLHKIIVCKASPKYGVYSKKQGNILLEAI